MEFTFVAADSSIKNVSISIYLPRRSLAYFEGDVRYGWKHSISSRKTDKLWNLGLDSNSNSLEDIEN